MIYFIIEHIGQGFEAELLFSGRKSKKLRQIMKTKGYKTDLSGKLEEKVKSKSQLNMKWFTFTKKRRKQGSFIPFYSPWEFPLRIIKGK